MTKKDKLRARIAKLTKSYVRKHGEVKTSPITPATDTVLTARQKILLHTMTQGIK